MRWTTKQQQVIDIRKRNILVSAAAGSGKTAVLVERIIKMITEEKNCIDIDKLLVVTFTKAAASEMRERVLKALEEKLIQMPENPHLQKQMSLIHSAQITTIHSFCQSVIKSYFHTIDLDPAFRIADEAELIIIKSAVIQELLEDFYEIGEEDFIQFIESYATGKTDTGVEDLVLQLYNFSMSYPWPNEWLLQCANIFELETYLDLENAPWMKQLLYDVKMILEDVLVQVEGAITMSCEVGGPYMYVDALESDKDMVVSLLRTEEYKDYYELFSNISFARLSSKKDEAVIVEKREEVKEIRAVFKKLLTEIQKQYFFQSEEECFKDIVGCKVPMNVLINITQEFQKRYAQKKEERNIIDFNDLEHLALKILVKKEDGKVIPTSAALEYRELYEEILIDEYQDSNLVQETLLTSISKESLNTPNVFMVGDVKQSIYKFRLARPELFMEKYNNYSVEESLYQKIDLHQNFRSRSVTLEPINFIFEQIMQKRLGGIAYDEEAKLYVGAEYENGNRTSTCSELILVEDDEEYDSKELEARAAAIKIKELLSEDNGLMVKDGDGLRCAKGKDVVVLLRTMAGWSDVYVDTFLSMGIPAYSDTRTGYFKTVEIKTVLDYLRIIDNRQQDIPFTAILHSPIVGLNNEQLALIRAYSRNTNMSSAALNYLEYEDGNKKIKEKLKKLFGQLDSFWEMCAYVEISELIERIIEDTGYFQYVSSMPGGSRRGGNLKMLVEKAVIFQSGSSKGLFQFVNYIEKLHKYDVDFGEASIGAKEDSVCIMSIHKSKGLEFPIVIVAGMSKKFNHQDLRKRLVIHPDLGLGPDFVDDKLRIHMPTLLKKVIQRQGVIENISEELRILYVALTRAKEKLIMIGTVSDVGNSIDKWNQVKNHRERELPFFKLSTASNYLDFVVPALIRNKLFMPILEKCSKDYNSSNSLYEEQVDMEISVVNISEVVKEDVVRQIGRNICADDLIQFDINKVYNGTIRDNIEKVLNYEYAYKDNVLLSGKISVSEIKRISMEETDDSQPLSLVNEEEDIIPEFMKEGTQIKATARGVLYHRVLENIDFKVHTKAKDLLNNLMENGVLTKDEVSCIKVSKIQKFLNSNIAKRMKVAQEKGTLYREQPFVIGVMAKEIYPESNSEECILVQGMIDAFFEEDNNIVLIDYKTDIIGKGETEQSIVERYKVQFNYYKRALEQLRRKPVNEVIMYLFSVDKEVGISPV